MDRDQSFVIHSPNEDPTLTMIGSWKFEGQSSFHPSMFFNKVVTKKKITQLGAKYVNSVYILRGCNDFIAFIKQPLIMFTNIV